MKIFGSEILWYVFQDGMIHISGIIWRIVSAKFNIGMCEMKILGSEFLGMNFCKIGSGWVGTHAWSYLFRIIQAKFETGIYEMNIFGLKFVVCLGMLVQDGLAHIAWSYLFRIIQAKFETGIYEMNIFGLKFVVCLGMLVQDGLAHMRGVTWIVVPVKFKIEVGWDGTKRV